MKFNILIPSAKKDITFISKVITYLRRCLPEAGNIYVITAVSLRKYVDEISRIDKNVIFLDENKVVEGLSIDTVNNILKDTTKKRIQGGWYFQQFLKYGFALTEFAEDYYLTWDSDTLPLANISFFKNSHPVFTLKDEYNENYFQTTKKLLGIDKINENSFIAEHMMFKTSIVKEMLEKITESEVEGNTWFEKIIRSGNYDHKFPAFSEFETYGTYCMYYHPDLYSNQKLNTFRSAGLIRGRNISEDLLERLSFDLDIASFEWNDQPPFPYNWRYIIGDFILKMGKLKKTPIKQLLVIFREKMKKKEEKQRITKLPQKEDTLKN